MASTVNANDLTVVHRTSDGMAMATVPDVCKTPSPAGGAPVPVPYPNIAMSSDLVNGTTTVTVDGQMAAIQGSKFVKSTGDEAGAAGGVVSGVFIMEAEFISASPTVMMDGLPVNRLSDKNGDVSVGPPSLRRLNSDGLLMLRRTISMPLPLPEWTFFRSTSVTPDFELTEETGLKPYNDLLNAYENIWKLLKRRDLERLLPMFEERSLETDHALYQAPGTTQAKLRIAFEEALNNADRELQPIRPPEDHFWIYEAGLTGKMMRLSTGNRGGTILRFADKEHAMFSTIFPIVFRKQGDTFIVAR